MQRTTARTLVLAFAAAMASSATAKTAVFTYSDCQPGIERLAGPLGPGAPPIINIPIPTPKTAAQRDWVLQQLNQQFPMILATPLDTVSIVIRNIPANAEVSSSSGDTGSQAQARTAAATHAMIAFPGHFDPMDRSNQPAVFTAGIVTDVGVLTDHVSAAELNFQTDGPIICQALFQRLAPRAPQYGAQINYAGDRLEVYFDPAYTVSPGGGITGSTSRSQQQEVKVYLPDDMMAGDTITGYVFGGGQTGVAVSLVDIYDFIPPRVEWIPFFLVAPTTPTQTRDVALSAMQTANVPAVVFGPNMIHVPTTQPQAGMRAGGASTSGTVLRPGTTAAEVKFPNVFAPLDRNGQPAVFTAGIVTDVGILSVNVTAAELNFQTDGPIICQALFQRLAPRAPQYGAQINYAGDRLEVYFDPAYTVTQGGASGGTTSPTPGVIWSINPDPAAPGSGDLNIDGDLNGLDVQPLLGAMTSPMQYWIDYPAGDIDQADLNSDHVVNGLDGALLRDRILGR